MVRLLLLLCGARLVNRTWPYVLSFGILWCLFGLLSIIDGLDDYRIYPAYYSIPLFIFGLGSLMSGLSKGGTARKLRLTKAAAFLLLALLIFFNPPYTGFLIGIIIGAFLVFAGIWRAFWAIFLRFANWRFYVGFAIAEFLCGVWSIVPWPTHWKGAVGVVAGLLIMLSSVSIIVLGARLRRLKPTDSVSLFIYREWPTIPTEDDISAEPVSESEHGEVVVHVWTPSGKLAPLHKGITRYVAYMNEKGLLSTGHSSMEVGDDEYLSFYPVVDVDQTRFEFTKSLKATEKNNVPGVFMENYRRESSDWCPSTAEVRFNVLNVKAIRRFCRSFKQDATYNISNRNCSSSVSQALDAGLEGIYEKRIRASLWFLIELMFTLDLWVAGFIKQQALGASWTPGVTLEYARAVASLLRQVPPRPPTNK